MSGFFKKMFSRITGKNEPVAPQEPEEITITAPESEQEPNDVASQLTTEVVVSVPVDDHVDLAPIVVEPAPIVEKLAPKKKATTAPPVKKKEKPLPKKRKQKAEPVSALKKPVRNPKKLAPEIIPEAPATVSTLTPALHPATEHPRAQFKHGRLAPAQTATQPENLEVKLETSGWLSRLTLGLSKSSKSITSSISSVFTKRKLDADTLQDFEDVLIQADLGVTVSERIVKALAHGRHDKEIVIEDVRTILAQEVEKVLQTVEVPFSFGDKKPFVILVVGVNGAGKTTTIGKLGAIARAEGYKVMFAACDTFRAAAIEQLTVWGERIGARTISRPTGADSSGLAFDAMQAATAEQADILFIDTAGRLQNKTYLMEELEKIVRVIAKQDATAPHAVLLVLDATTGQNALAQAEVFTKVAGVTGIIMTKLDGTARGGILVAIAEKFKIPIHAIGVGEAIEDLQPFDAHAFALTIAGLERQ